MNRRFLPFVGIDDFAFCKGHTYGTLICNLQSNAPLAILPDRLPETVAHWLMQHPFIQVVSRDGFNSFRQAITQANNQIIQVYDRWHFIRNAKKQMDSFLPATMIALNVDPPCEPILAIPLTRTEQRMKERQYEKWKYIREIQQTHKKGKNTSRISMEYQLDRRTVTTYLNMNEPPVFTRRRFEATDAFKEQIIKLEQAGNTVKKIFHTIQTQGYQGTLSAVSTLVIKIRKERKHGLQRNLQKQISRRQLGSWIWKSNEELCEDEQSNLVQCFELYPPVKFLYDNIQVYRKAIESRDWNMFLSWLRKQLSSRENAFYHYAFRLRSDLQAVKNAFLTPYSNGLLEGQINRLKTIKCMTYGRAGLEILEKRILRKL